jgi:hypothetical protein
MPLVLSAAAAVLAAWVTSVWMVAAALAMVVKLVYLLGGLRAGRLLAVG